MGIHAVKNDPGVNKVQCNTKAGKRQGKKWCPKCEEWKDRSRFYADKQNKDGFTGECKECRIERSSQWYRDNREWANKRNSQWQHDNPERIKELRKEWILNNYDKHRDSNNKARLRHRKRYPEREFARTTITKAKRRGLTLGRCFWPGCSVTTEIHGHHPRYSKPYEIIPLCKDHHRKWHKLNGNLPFTLPTLDISEYLKKSKRPRPKHTEPDRVGVAV